MKAEKLCHLLEWDTGFFGFRIARLTPSRMTGRDMQRALTWCEGHAIDCLYYLADSDHEESTRLAERNGFHLIDIRLTLERRLARAQEKKIKGLPEVRIRAFQESDLRHLKTIAREVYSDTRFFRDPHFPRGLAEGLYVTWIEKSCRGGADAVLVLERHQKPIGYITCHRLQEHMGQIGLVGLHAKARGEGGGRQLVDSALRQFQQWGMKRVEVVTQGRNLNAQRLYQSCGFMTKNLQLWYHKWFRI